VATRQGLAVDEVISEVVCGLNWQTAAAAAAARRAAVTTIVVKHCDRLARFGVEHLEATLAAQDRTLVVVDPAGQMTILCAT
jgi:putative resolvase